MINLRSAVAAIEKHGVLLVFPDGNRERPRSLWSHFHPKTPMRWAWDDSADTRVVDTWHLRAQLAESRRVVYSKWYRGRATFFSHAVFAGMLSELLATGRLFADLPREARVVLEQLDDNSPQSTKELRRSTDLTGRANEAAYTRGLKELFSRLIVVGAGEVDDGAFPSLAVGATRLLFEDLWARAEEGLEEDRAAAKRAIDATPEIARAWGRVRAALDAGGAAPKRGRTAPEARDRDER